jgi:hypothetical protein
MSLPMLQQPRCRQLAQAVWDLANANLRWSTFAELDRRLDSHHDLQAEEVIREMPPGFLYGFGPNSPVPPHDSQDIALTVAGVAACRDTSEALSIFLQLVQIAAATEKGWEPPPGAQDGAAPTLTTAQFAVQAPNLPAAGRQHLLQLVFLMLKPETSVGWTGLGGPDANGQWTITLDRRIRAFRGVQSIDDYWSRRYKPWEAQRPTPATTLPFSTGLTAAAREPATVSVNSYSFNAPVSAANFAAGDHATQHATITGTNTDDLRHAMQAILDALPSLNLETGHHDQAVHLAAEVITETQTLSHDPGWLTWAAHKLADLIATSAKTALSATLTALIETALTKAGLPSGTGT